MAKVVFAEPESRTIAVRGLAKNIRDGHWQLLLPSFQRAFVWDDEDIKKFIESLIRGYPSGTILLWKPSNPEIDPFALKFLDGPAPHLLSPREGEKYYVIDGQQRLTALMLMMNGWCISRGGKLLKRSAITINPSKEDPEIFIDPNERRGYDIYRGIKDRLFTDIEESEKLKQELGKVAYNRYMTIIDKILDYTLPVYIIKTSNENPDILGLMANIFIMVNRSGQRITNMELLLAYTAGIFDRDLAKRIRNIYDDLQKDFGDVVSITSFIRFAFSKPSLDLTQNEIDNVEKFKSIIDERKKQITINGKNKLQEIYESLDVAGKSYRLALSLVNYLFGAAAVDLLPSSLSLIPVACYFHKERLVDIDSLSKTDLSNIKKWLLLVNFNGYYSARTSSRLQKDIESVYSHSGNSFPYNEFLENIMKGKKSAAYISRENIEEGKYKDLLKRPSVAYLFVLYTALVDNDAENWKGKLIRNCRVETLAKAHIFPRECMSKKLLSAELYDEDEKGAASKGINGLGNITLMDREENSSLKDQLPKKYLLNYSTELLRQHFIPNEPDYWEIERFDDFIEYRTNLIIEFLKQRYDDILE